VYDREEIANVTCPASITITGPLEVALGFTPGILIGFEIVIPDGHSGLTDIALGYAHQPTVPWTPGGYFSGNDEVIRRFTRDKVPGVPWSTFLRNYDLQPHSWQVRFLYDELDYAAISVASTAISAADIYAAGSTSAAVT
jgi:hypothetical protein